MDKRILGLGTLLLMGAATAHDDQEHHHALTADLHAFHQRLAPLWHAPAGAERLSNTCAAAPELAQLASAVRSVDAKALQHATALLRKHCANEPRDIEQAFSAVHDAFHALIND
jgi:hypothetical protein